MLKVQLNTSEPMHSFLERNASTRKAATVLHEFSVFALFSVSCDAI